ncbi:uncharacterized protein LOC113562951 [Ooceraea biroi]|uniref:uncharacterized protein LOC113562951 n=1 Tax=Ooceraea biroi TaxID=2015173 RepID=UPI000F07679D|nr:uncharacterized protein LOC113562951 [Ooceraea biroi]
MADVLDIAGEPVFDERIVGLETHTYNPYANTSFGYSDEIRIPIQQQDLYTLPYESYLYIEGTFSIVGTAAGEGDGGAAHTNQARLVNNCAAFLFDEIRYELNGIEIDRSRNNAGWSVVNNTSGPGDFNLCVPLGTLLGFCEDYRRVVINARHELVLIRARNDINCVVLSSDRHEPKIDLHKSTTAHTWAVKAATQLEKPRYVIFALQTGRRNIATKDASLFDECNLSNVKLFLNSEFYLYDDMHLDFTKNRYAVLYDMYARFRRAYYALDRDDDGAMLTLSKFLPCGPLVVIGLLEAERVGEERHR